MAYYNGMYGNGFGYPSGGPVPAPVQQGTQSGIIWVQGLEGAKSYMVPPGSTVLLMDSESKRFYIKSVDSLGRPTLNTYEFTELTNPTQTQYAGDFVTRDEFKTLEAKIEALSLNKKKGTQKDE